MFRVYFGKLSKNDLKSIISFNAPSNLLQEISEIKYAVYNSYEVYYHPQNIRKIGVFLGKN